MANVAQKSSPGASISENVVCGIYTSLHCICERVTLVHHCTSPPCTSGVECWCQPAQQKMQAALPQVPVQATMVPHGWAPKVIAVSTQLFQFLSQMPLTCCSKSNINTESGLVLKSPFPLPTMGSYAIMFLKRKSLFLKTSELFSHRLNRASRRLFSVLQEGLPTVHDSKEIHPSKEDFPSDLQLVHTHPSWRQWFRSNFVPSPS